MESVNTGNKLGAERAASILTRPTSPFSFVPDHHPSSTSSTPVTTSPSLNANSLSSDWMYSKSTFARFPPAAAAGAGSAGPTSVSLMLSYALFAASTGAVTTAATAAVTEDAAGGGGGGTAGGWSSSSKSSSSGNAGGALTMGARTGGGGGGASGSSKSSSSWLGKEGGALTWGGGRDATGGGVASSSSSEGGAAGVDREGKEGREEATLEAPAATVLPATAAVAVRRNRW